MSNVTSRISGSFDFDGDGKQIGHLRLPYSSNRSAYGWIGIPIAIVKNGRGPTLYLGGGNHGDEYEGQIALTRLIREFDPATLQGRLIILPASNLPAAMNHSRCSPIDGGNLNRSFPGNAAAPDHQPTTLIAHYIESVLLPKCDAMLDIHSGGKTLDYIPCGMIRQNGGDDPLFPRKLEALKSLGTSLGYIVKGSGSPVAGKAESSITCAADRVGILGLSTELGGAGRVTRQSLETAKSLITNLLAHLGMIDAPSPAERSKANPTRLIEVSSPEHYVYAPCQGAFEPVSWLGDEVEAGQICGWIHQIDDPKIPAREVRFKRAGLLFCQRPIVAVERGDCLGHLGTDWRR